MVVTCEFFNRGQRCRKLFGKPPDVGFRAHDRRPAIGLIILNSPYSSFRRIVLSDPPLRLPVGQFAVPIRPDPPAASSSFGRHCKATRRWWYVSWSAVDQASRNSSPHKCVNPLVRALDTFWKVAGSRRGRHFLYKSDRRAEATGRVAGEYGIDLKSTTSGVQMTRQCGNLCDQRIHRGIVLCSCLSSRGARSVMTTLSASIRETRAQAPALPESERESAGPSSRCVLSGPTAR